MKEKIVILGNGIAALSAIKAIREVDSISEIHVYGEEPYYPYNRIRLSKGLLSALEEDKILLQKKEWYKTNHVNMYIGKKAVFLDPLTQIITFQDGSQTDYTKLLIATGASNAIPPIKGIEKKGVFTLRTLEDAQRITSQQKQGSSFLNIGGGIQGLETAWILSQLHKKVIVAELLPRLMPKQLDHKASTIVEKVIQAQDIEVLTNTQISEITGNACVQGFLTADNENHPCDTVLYSIGICPNTHGFTDTNLMINKGIVVNEKMQTNIPHIYAAGDVAEFQDEIYGLWNIAIEQGKIAGYNMVGKESYYTPITPVTTLTAFGISLFSMGIVDETKSTHVVMEDQSEQNMYSKIFIRNQTVIGAIVIGTIKSSPALKSAIENKIPLGDLNFSNVSVETLIEIIKKNK